MKKWFLVLLSVLLLAGCGNKKENTQDQATTGDSTAQVKVNADYMSLAVLYYQKAAETRALYYQGFNVARMMIDNDLKVKSKLKKAVVLDIDETALDNSPYEAQCILGNFAYPERWDEWCNAGKAEPTPGAVEFLNYAAEKGYAIFYITNRKAKFTESTLKNLRDKGFPMADTTHVLFRTAGNSKEERRVKVMKEYNIVMLMGDNLADFTRVFDEKLSLEQRIAKTDSLKQEFGKKFIVFPNPMYGDWEMAVYPDPAASPAVKDSLRKSCLQGF